MMKCKSLFWMAPSRKRSLQCILQLPEMWPNSAPCPQNIEDRGATWLLGYEQVAESMGNLGRHKLGRCSLSHSPSLTHVCHAKRTC